MSCIKIILAVSFSKNFIVDKIQYIKDQIFHIEAMRRLINSCAKGCSFDHCVQKCCRKKSSKSRCNSSNEALDALVNFNSVRLLVTEAMAPPKESAYPLRSSFRCFFNFSIKYAASSSFSFSTFSTISCCSPEESSHCRE